MTQENPKAELFETLKLSLQKEISMMREILSNMHREELSLQFDDKSSWEQVMVERAQMVLRLGSLRDARLSAMEEFEKHASFESSDGIEILSLRDQLLALAERMNQLKQRNDYLSEQFRKHPGTRGGSAPAPNGRMPIPKRKTTVATYPPKK